MNVDPDGRSALFLLSDQPERDRAKEDPERARRMTSLAVGFHQWAKYLLSHNKPLKEAKP